MTAAYCALVLRLLTCTNLEVIDPNKVGEEREDVVNLDELTLAD